MKNPNEIIDQQTISDFGEQWTRYPDSSGYYGSRDCLADIFGPLLDSSQIAGKRVADIGSGTGRIVNMLLDADAECVIAVEPSAAFSVLQKNTLSRQERVKLINATGEAIAQEADIDLVVSLGVLHHIVDPGPVVRAAFKALKPGGTMLVWLYAHEGNELYLSMANALRAVTVRLPHAGLSLLCSMLNVFLDVYMLLCRILPLPLRDYLNNHLSKLDRQQRKLTIYDQLNPAYAKYYRKQEAVDLLAQNGFIDVRAFHRHHYSWTIAGIKPDA